MQSKTKLNLPFDWIYSFNRTDSVNIDIEFYTLMLKAYEVKITEQINKEKFDGFLEHIYHAMNLNSFLIDGKLYDTKFMLIPSDKYTPYINNVKMHKTDSNIFKVLKIAQIIFKSTLLLYLEKMPKGNTLVFNNHLIHKSNDINILAKELNTGYYQLWNMKIGNNYKFINSIQRIARLNISDDVDIQKILIDAKPTINQSNMIGVNMIDNTPVSDIIMGIKDTILLNRIFKPNSKFKASLYIELSNYIKSNGKFDYRFKIN